MADKLQTSQLATNNTLQKALDRKRKRLAKAQNKLKYSKQDKDKETAREAIRELKLDMLHIEQQIIFNNAQRG